MVIFCKVQMCPYNSKNGFCRKRVLKITGNGQCGHIFNDGGNQNQRWQEPVPAWRLDGYRKPEEAKENLLVEDTNN